MASMCPSCRMALRRSLSRSRRYPGSLPTKAAFFHQQKTKASAAVAYKNQNEAIDDFVEQRSSAQPQRPLSLEQRKYLDSALRVNQAGELAAVLIYDAQIPPMVRSYPQLMPLMRHMYDQEAGHFKLFNQLLAKHRIRPTAMYPVWRAAATVLGWSTAVMGREAAMACTEAVETEIGKHYNDQVRVILNWAKDAEARGEGLGEELTELLGELRRIRDEELEHLDEAVGEGAKEAKPYWLLNNIIRSGCRGAIWLTEKI